MWSKLSCLPVGDQCADGNQTSVPWRKVRAKPHITEQYVSGVLHHARKKGAELLLDDLTPVGLGCIVERQERDGHTGELINIDVTRREDILCHANRRHRVAPAGVEGEVRDDL